MCDSIKKQSNEKNPKNFEDILNEVQDGMAQMPIIPTQTIKSNQSVIRPVIQTPERTSSLRKHVVMQTQKTKGEVIKCKYSTTMAEKFEKEFEEIRLRNRAVTTWVSAPQAPPTPSKNV